MSSVFRLAAGTSDVTRIPRKVQKKKNRICVDAVRWEAKRDLTCRGGSADANAGNTE